MHSTISNELSQSRYHDKPATLAESGKKPSSLVKSSLVSFELSLSSFEEDFRLRAAAGFLALCISLHLEPLEHLPVVENSSHSRMCFLLHCQNKNKNNYVLTVNNYTANDTKTGKHLATHCFWRKAVTCHGFTTNALWLRAKFLCLLHVYPLLMTAF